MYRFGFECLHLFSDISKSDLLGRFMWSFLDKSSLVFYLNLIFQQISLKLRFEDNKKGQLKQ